MIHMEYNGAARLASTGSAKQIANHWILHSALACAMQNRRCPWAQINLRVARPLRRIWRRQWAVMLSDVLMFLASSEVIHLPLEYDV